jgi:hypothetical protein
MADFARWGTAVERALGWPAGSFMTAYSSNRALGSEHALEASPLVLPLQKLISAYPDGWEGPARELLAKLMQSAPADLTKHRAWPKDEARLGASLARLAPDLRVIGIGVQRMPRRHGGTRVWRVERLGAPPSPPSPPSTQGLDVPISGDGDWDTTLLLSPNRHPSTLAVLSQETIDGDDGDGGDGWVPVGSTCTDPLETGGDLPADEADGDIDGVRIEWECS